MSYPLFLCTTNIAAWLLQGVCPPNHIDKYETYNLGGDIFVLYHPMLRYRDTVTDTYGTNVDQIHWCLYMARGGTDRNHCIDIDQNNIEIHVFDPISQSWQHMIQCMLLVSSNTVARFTFMTGNRRVTKQIVVPVPKSLE